MTTLPAPDLRQPAILVTGATGFVGRALVADLRRNGQRVIAWSRDVRQAQAALGPGVQVVGTLDALPPGTPLAAVVQLAGARVLGRPWTAARRRVLLDSRVGTLQQVVGLMRRLAAPPRVLVVASAVGYYGAVPGDAPCTEASPPRPGEFQSDLCVALEQAALQAEPLGVRVVRLRFGVVLGHGGGAYPMQALAARLGLGAVLGSGRQFAPWVHREDAVGLIRFALAHEALGGAVNAVAPQAVRQGDFARALAASLGRRAWLRVPGGPLRLLGEMSTLLLDGQHVQPAAAIAAGYAFRHSTVESALRALARQG